MADFPLKPGQNKKGQNFFQLHRFFNTFLQQAAEKKYSKNGAAGNFFGPFYFVTALERCMSRYDVHEVYASKNFTNKFVRNIIKTYFP